jgi:hypothetical protein
MQNQTLTLPAPDVILVLQIRYESNLNRSLALAVRMPAAGFARYAHRRASLV